MAESLEAGAFGLSTGLAYSHEVTITDLEIAALVKEVVKRDTLFSVHLRNEGAQIIESINEALDISRHTGAKIKLSHLKIREKENYHHFDELINILDSSYHQGINVKFDAYPYDSVWQVIYSYLPRWSVLGGRAGISQHLNNPQDRKKILDELKEKSHQLSNLIIASTGNELGMVGKSVASIAKNSGLGVEEVFIELVLNAGSESLVFDRCLDEVMVLNFLSHPLSVAATDGAGFQERRPGKLNDKLVHPRCFGALPRFIKLMQSSKKLNIQKIVNKLTKSPAEIMGLKKRGSLVTGFFADVTIFDQKEISDPATLTNPFLYSNGIQEVIVNGVRSVIKGQLTEKIDGRVIRKNEQ